MKLISSNRLMMMASYIEIELINRCCRAYIVNYNAIINR